MSKQTVWHKFASMRGPLSIIWFFGEMTTIIWGQSDENWLLVWCRFWGEKKSSSTSDDENMIILNRQARQVSSVSVKFLNLVNLTIFLLQIARQQSCLILYHHTAVSDQIMTSFDQVGRPEPRWPCSWRLLSHLSKTVLAQSSACQRED